MRNLPDAQLSTVSEHVSECSGCGAELVSTLRRQRGESELSFTLAPEFWLRHDHLDYAQLVDLAENKLDATDRELIDAHFRVCQVCQEDVKSLLAFREQIAPEMAVSYAPIGKESVGEPSSSLGWWRALVWKPIYSAALVAIGMALVIGAIFLLNRRTNNQQVQQVPAAQVSPISTPAVTINIASPTGSPSKSPIETPSSQEPVIALSDRGGTITVDNSGNVSGLEDVPGSTRDEIAQVLLSERLDAPAILKELRGQEGGLRGSNNKQPFKLISPSRAVIVSDLPMFSWEKAQGASAYKVYVNDLAGHEVARSEELPPESINWRLQKALKRGEIYSWTVVAVVDGKEIVSPGPSSPEMKFRILSTNSLQQLNELLKTRSHLALGVFYAREGMSAEAQHQFEILARDNSGSRKTNKLLRQIQSWQRR